MIKIISLILLLGTSPVLAQIAAIQGHSFLGGTQAVTSGLKSSNYMQGIVPSATICVYNTGTTAPATIYANASGAPLSSCFTSNASISTDPGGWIFWAAINQGFDVVMSGGVSPNMYPAPVTISDLYPSTQITAGCGFGTVCLISQGGTGATTAAGALSNLGGVDLTVVTLPDLSLPYSQLSGTVPTWNQSTTGNAANVTGTVAIANGGTGATTAAGANLNITGVTQTGTLGTSSQVSTFSGAVTALTFNGLTFSLIGTETVSVGVNAIPSASTSIGSTALGELALGSLTAGTGNTALGRAALATITSGGLNTAIGYNAAITTGYTSNTQSTYVGANTAAAANGDTNETVIGYGVVGHGSNTVAIGNSSVTNTYLYTPSLGTTPLTLTEIAGTSGTTAHYLVVFDGATGNIITAPTVTFGVVGIALTTATSGQSVEMVTTGTTQCVSDGVIATGDLLVVGTSTAGRCKDSGVQFLSQVASNLQVVGRAQSAASAANQLVTMFTVGAGHLGASIVGASTIAITTQSSNTSYYPIFVPANSSSNQAVSVGPMTYNPSTGNLTPMSINTAPIGWSGTNANIGGSMSLSAGSSNTAVGIGSMQSLTSGQNNTAIGEGALEFITTSSYNTAVGSGAGSNSGDTTNANSIFLGFQAFPSANGNTNETVIGYSAVGNGSNTVTLGNGSVTGVFMGTTPLVTTTTLDNATLPVSATSGTFSGAVSAQAYNATTFSTGAIGVVTTGSNLYLMSLPSFAYGISANALGGLDIMANQAGEPIRLWAGTVNASPTEVASFINTGAQIYESLTVPSVTPTGGTGNGFVHAIIWDNSTNTTTYTTSQLVGTFYSPVAGTIPSGGTGTYNAVAATSYCHLVTAATASTTFTFADGGTSFGTVAFAASGTTGTFTISSAKSVASGDKITLTAPSSADATAAGLNCSLVFAY